MDYDRIRERFKARFPTGEFHSLDFRKNFDGYGHNAWLVIEPLDTAAATRDLAYARLGEMVDHLRPDFELFEANDRIQFAVLLAQSASSITSRILLGWIPAICLPHVQPADFAAVGGALSEADNWSDGIWFRAEHEFESL